MIYQLEPVFHTVFDTLLNKWKNKSLIKMKLVHVHIQYIYIFFFNQV